MKKIIGIICLTILAILLCWTILVPAFCVIGITEIAEENKDEKSSKKDKQEL